MSLLGETYEKAMLLSCLSLLAIGAEDFPTGLCIMKREKEKPFPVSFFIPIHIHVKDVF